MKRYLKFIKVLLVFLISIIGFLILFFIFINLPFSHRFVTRQTNQILRKSDLPIHIQSIRVILPTTVNLQGVGIIDFDNDTIIYAGELQVDVLLPALLVKKVRLKKIYVGNVSVKLSRNDHTAKYNIADIFAPDKKSKKVVPENEKKSWEISIKKGELSRINFQMNDPIIGIRIFQKIEGIKLKNFNLSLHDSAILLKSIEVNGAEGDVKITPHPLRQTSNNGSPWNFGLQKISFNDLNFTYDHGSDSLLLNLILEEGLIRANQMDLNKKEIDIDKIFLKRAKATLLTGNPSTDPKSTIKLSTGYFPWDLKAKEIDLEYNAIKLGSYNDHSPYSPAPEINITDLDMSLSDIRINNVNAALGLKKLNFKTGNGFSLTRTKGELESDSGTTRLNLEIETGNSQFHLKGDADARFFDIIAAPSEIQKAEISIRKSSFSLKDISYFITDLQRIAYFKTLTKMPYTIEGDLNLANSVLNLSGFSVSQARNFRFTLEGIAEYPFKYEESRVDLQLGIPDIDMAWMKEMLAAFGIEENVPEFTKLSVEGTISDSFRSPDFSLKLESDLGNVDLLGSLDFKSDHFLVNAEFDRLMLGKVLNIERLGLFYGSGDFNGSGFNYDSLIASITVLVDSLGFNDYDYTRAKIEGALRPGDYDFNLLVDDPSLKCNLNANVNSADSALTVKATGTLLAQLNNLHLIKDTLAIESKITANFIKKRGVIETDFSVADLNLTTSQDYAEVQQISASFKTDTVKTSLNGEADFFNATIRIDKPIGELETLIQSYRNYIGSFIDTLELKVTARVSYLPEMKATTNITYHDALGLFIPDTTLRFTNLDFSLINKTSDQRINYNIKGTGLEYKWLKMGDLNASITDSAGLMKLKVVADNASIYASPKNKLLLASRFIEGKSWTELTILNKQDSIIYGFEIASELDSSHIVLKVPSGELIMNQEHWYMDTPVLATVNLATKKVSPELKMHTDSSILRLFTVIDNGMRQYCCELSNVAFASLIPDHMIPGNPVGTISGSLGYGLNGDHGRQFNTDLRLKNVGWSDLNFNKINLNGFFRSDNPGDYRFDITARMDSSGIDIKGEKQEDGNRTVSSEFTSIPIHTFQPFVKDYLSELKGQLSGNFNISSSENNERFRGEINIEDANLKINSLNSKYKIPEENVLFTGKKMVLSKFRVLDSLDNELLVDGFIDFSDHRSVTADLEVFSSKLQVMNRSEKENASFYGDIFIDSRLSFRGPLANPVIKGKILLSEGTEVFYRQMEDLTLSESEKIVSFVSHKSNKDQIIEPPIEGGNTFGNSSIETIVEIDPTTKMNFNLSKRIYTIDLMIKGGGSLNYYMLRHNQVSLSGKYEISEGTADVNLIGWPNKSFRIAKGGFVRWDGMIENPELKFEALNRVSSSYINPVDGKQRDVDFNVILQLSNHLSELDVVFTINTTDQYLMSIINTLSPEEQMRQAITTLLFENIDLPGISTSTNYMTEQVNQLISSQLNQLTKTTIKGIDISFGIDSYVQSTQTGGEETKTSLSYEVRKELLNNRAQIELSGRLNDLNQQPGASDLSLNNITFEYRLDSAATKYLKVYNEQSYEDVFVGEVTKTGIGFTYRKRYRSFGNIWKREERNSEMKNQGK